MLFYKLRVTWSFYGFGTANLPAGRQGRRGAKVQQEQYI